MIVYRLSKAAFAADLSGKGAEITGGRWNSKGIVIVYTSESRALCTVEIAVHMPLGMIPEDYKIISIEIPEQVSVEEIFAIDLPEGWNSMPDMSRTRQIGDRFIHDMKFPVIKVPSAVIQDEHNILINPKHPDSKLITIKSIEPYNFDKRLFL